MTDTGSIQIRVLVADCKLMWSELLAGTLRQDARFEAAVTDGTPSSFATRVAALQPDILLVGVEGSEADCAAFKMLRAAHVALPKLKSVVLLESSKGELIREAFRAGARGVINRADPAEVLIDCVCCVHEGRIWARNDQFSCFLELLGQYTVGRAIMSACVPELLTRRELDLVECVAKGMTNRAIAVQLQLSEHTVRNYLFRIFRKFGVSNRAELVCTTMHHGQRADHVHAVSQQPA